MSLADKIKKKRKLAELQSRQTSDGAPTILSADLHIVGDIASDGEVHLDGRIDGNVSCGRLTVGRGAYIKGKITTDYACVHGKLVGSLAADEVVLRETAQVTGDVTHQRLEIDAGAVVNGFYKNVDAQALEDRKVKALLPGKPAGRPNMEKPRRPRLKKKSQAPQYTEVAVESGVEAADKSDEIVH